MAGRVERTTLKTYQVCGCDNEDYCNVRYCKVPIPSTPDFSNLPSPGPDYEPFQVTWRPDLNLYEVFWRMITK